MSRLLVTVSTLNEARLQNMCPITQASVRYRYTQVQTSAPTSSPPSTSALPRDLDSSCWVSFPSLWVSRTQVNLYKPFPPATTNLKIFFFYFFFF